MSQTQFDILGLSNVFADVNQRYFEPSLEDIIRSDPDVIEVVTYPKSSVAPPTIEDLKAFPGMDKVTAVKNGAVLIQPYAYSSQNPFAVEGLLRMGKQFADLK